MVEANNLTDRSYELVEKIERKKMLLTAVVIACFILAPIGIGINAYTFMTATHTKGDWSDVNIALMGIIFIISIVLFAVGIKKYILIGDLKDKLAQVRLLEETIYNEVLNKNLSQIK
jgi:uncharacterized membrane protein YcjF (UPF0283 family)